MRFILAFLCVLGGMEGNVLLTHLATHGHPLYAVGIGPSVALMTAGMFLPSLTRRKNGS